MKPQLYTIKDFSVGDFKDPNGNTWCEVVFAEDPSEQYRWVVKDPVKVTLGTKVYGHIEEKTSKAGKPYNRFYRDKQEDAPQTASTVMGHTGQSTDESIARSVALKAAVDSRWTKPETVIQFAEVYLAWLRGDVQKPVDEVQNKPAKRDEDDEAIDTYQRNAEPLPDFPEDM